MMRHALQFPSQTRHIASSLWRTNSATLILIRETGCISEEFDMASTPLNTVMKFGKWAHVAVYRMSRGKFANTIANLPILLLTTTRKSGKQQTTPVVYIKDGDDYLVSASMGGMDRNPAWYHNLKANPQAKIEVGDKTFNVTAVMTEGDERN